MRLYSGPSEDFIKNTLIVNRKFFQKMRSACPMGCHLKQPVVAKDPRATIYRYEPPEAITDSVFGTVNKGQSEGASLRITRTEVK